MTHNTLSGASVPCHSQIAFSACKTTFLTKILFKSHHHMALMEVCEITILYKKAKAFFRGFSSRRACTLGALGLGVFLLCGYQNFCFLQ